VGGPVPAARPGAPRRGAPGRFSGRTGRHEIVHVEGPAGVDLTGQLLRVEILEAYKHSLRGRVVGEVDRSRKAPPRRLQVLA
jgi:tRNA-2-methylthio-N6-dimethylallyladenosine synthase